MNAYQVTEATCVPVFATEDVIYAGDSILVRDMQFPGIAALVAEPSDMLVALEGEKVVFDRVARLQSTRYVPMHCQNHVPMALKTPVTR